jgi:hypothetical protein
MPKINKTNEPTKSNDFTEKKDADRKYASWDNDGCKNGP